MKKLLLASLMTFAFSQVVLASEPEGAVATPPAEGTQMNATAPADPHADMKKADASPAKPTKKPKKKKK